MDYIDDTLNTLSLLLPLLIPLLDYVSDILQISFLASILLKEVEASGHDGDVGGAL